MSSTFDPALIRQVRSFNRTVTQRIGVLHDEYLSRGRPLGASRVLWEIGGGATDVRSLRVQLDLDSGYLSRLLRTLEQQGLVANDPDPGDRRVRTVQLTASGCVEHRVLDERSDELAESLLAPLSPAERSRLVDAMGTVERLLMSSLVTIDAEDPASPSALWCMRSYFAELDTRFDSGFDPARALPVDPSELIEPAGCLLLARLRDEPVGCGAIKFHRDEPAEIKRIWVAASARGLGVGRRLLFELEQSARRRGVGSVRLDTNRSLHEAIGLYRSAGYVEVERFNAEPYADHWFAKHLGEAAAG